MHQHFYNILEIKKKNSLVVYVNFCVVFFLLLRSQGKPDLNTALPIRQTASIFKQPVTKVVNHPNNKVKTDLQRATEQPRQVSAFASATSDFVQMALIWLPYYGHAIIISCIRVLCCVQVLL